MTLPIVEIFNSIEGEGRRAGLLCTFIRTAGCNLRCSYCDTTYSYDESQAKHMDVDTVIQEVKRLGCPLVTITGGEPLLHGEVKAQLIPRLIRQGFQVNVETNGSIEIENLTTHFSPWDLILTVDWKSPSSRMEDAMDACKTIRFLRASDVLKFVVGNKQDLQEMLHVLTVHPTCASVYVSPVFQKIELRDIVQFLKDNKLYNVRMQVQLHKIVWDPNERGV